MNISTTGQSVEDQVLDLTSTAQLTAPLRARVTDESLEGFNRIEAFYKGKGYRKRLISGNNQRDLQIDTSNY